MKDYGEGYKDDAMWSTFYKATDSDRYKKYPKLLKNQAAKSYLKDMEALRDYSPEGQDKHTQTMLNNFSSKVTPEIWNKYKN